MGGKREIEREEGGTRERKRDATAIHTKDNE
jgi:hypothetical protein